MPIKTIYGWRRTGHGPCAIWVDRYLRFAIGDVRACVSEQREEPGWLAGWGEGW